MREQLEHTKRERRSSLFISSVANFGVQYNYTNMAIVFIFLDNSGKWPMDDIWGGKVAPFLKSIVFIGSIGGMCVMGYFGDAIGRTRAFFITSIIMIFSSLGTAFLTFGSTKEFIITLAVFRFTLGFGIGGCYPLSAAKCAEGCCSTSIWERNKFTGFAFFWQTMGDILPYVIGMMIYYIDNVEIQFRLAFALGSIPPLIVLLCTWGKEESSEYIQTKSTSIGTVSHIKMGMQDPNFIRNLLGTAGCWFLYDIAYYGNNQFTPIMTKTIFTGHSIFDNTWHTAVSLTMGIPATISAIYCLKSMGTKRLQVWGFLFISLLCFMIGAFWNVLTFESNTFKRYSLFSLYMVFQFFVNWGPNVSTFVLPQEIYHTEVRTTFNGVASAAGKFGATVGVWLYPVINQEFGIIWLMSIVGVLNMLGAAISYWAISDEYWKKQKRQLEQQMQGEAGTEFVLRRDEPAG